MTKRFVYRDSPDLALRKGVQVVTLLFLILGACMITPLSYADDSDDTKAKVEAVQLEIRALKKMIGRQEKHHLALKAKVTEGRERLQLQGFLSAGLSQSNRDLEYDGGEGGIGNDLTTLVRGKMGLQFDFAINKDTTAVLQVLGRANDNDWNLGTEWAYINYDVSPSFSIKVGRLRLSTFNLSAVIDVGYAYPWVRVPVHCYRPLAFQNFDGIEFSHYFFTDNWAYKFRWYTGENTASEDEWSLNNKDFIGIDFTATRGSFTYRFGSGKAHPEFNYPSAGIVDLKPSAYYVGTGISYDDGEWIMMSEFTRRDVGSELVADINGYYISLGKRFGSYLPYINYSQTRTTDDDSRNAFLAGLFNIRETNYTLGIRKELVRGLAAKVELWYLTNFDDTDGYFDSSIDFDNAVVAHVAIDAVF